MNAADTEVMPKVDPRFQSLLPPLSREELGALEASIKASGHIDPIVVDENDVILDGHHRHKVMPNAPVRVVKGLSDAEKRAFVFQANFARRNLSPEQKTVAREKMKAVALALKDEDKNKYTQPVISRTLGVDQSTVSRWLTPNMQTHNRSRTDARVKLDSGQKAEVIERVTGGESQQTVAADFGIGQQHASRIVTKAKTIAEKKAKDAQAARNFKKTGIQGVHHGDAFELAKEIPDSSCALMFCDPPYDRASLPTFSRLGALADRILIDGASLITYAGTYALRDEINLTEVGGVRLFWLCCCQHTGRTAQMREYGINVRYKPLLWFVKGSMRRDPHTWVDDLVVSQQEKGLHPWQQSVIEAEYYIEKLTVPGELVCDPYCGSGTTAVAAKALHRQWWTADIEVQHVHTARCRLDDAIDFGTDAA